MFIYNFTIDDDFCSPYVGFGWMNRKVIKKITTHNRKDKRMDQFNKYRLLTRKEAANFLGVKESTLAIWKSTKRHSLPVVKMGRLAKYRYGDLLEFVDRQTVNKPNNPANDH